MTAFSPAGLPDSSGSWRWPVDPARYDRAPLLRAAEQDAIIELGVGSLRRLARHDPAARGLAADPAPAAAARRRRCGAGGSADPHRRRAMLDATAVVLLRCAETGRSYWTWTEEGPGAMHPACGRGCPQRHNQMYSNLQAAR